jgi:hypothetical protein
MDFEELLYFIFMEEQEEKTVAQNENGSPWENRPQQTGMRG